MKKNGSQTSRLRRGIYILPNLFTSLNMFCGFFAIISSIEGNYQAAAASILIAVVFDSLDGKIARATNTTSKFGIEYDSLSDLISFGLAPGLMVYMWALQPMGRMGWLAAFLFAICGALRLARFNTMAETTPSDHFIGLPIPAGAAMNATAVLFISKFNLLDKIEPVFIIIALYSIAFLMVSAIKYNSFKNAELFKKMKFNVLVIAVIAFTIIAQKPQVVLFSLALVYVLSGPAVTILMMLKPRNSEVKDG
jgi:CDP-diacylglycerol--serine O-phosphatidyltransferase